MPRSRVLLLVGCSMLFALSCGSDSLTGDAGEDFTVVVGEAPTFDGCSSTGDIANYEWAIIGAPPARVSDEGKALRDVSTGCRFTLESAMVVDEVGAWTIELTVTDGDGAADTDTVEVVVVE